MKRIVTMTFEADTIEEVENVELWLTDKIWDILGDQGSPIFNNDGETTGIIILNHVAVSVETKDEV